MRLVGNCDGIRSVHQGQVLYQQRSGAVSACRRCQRTAAGNANRAADSSSIAEGDRSAGDIHICRRRRSAECDLAAGDVYRIGYSRVAADVDVALGDIKLTGSDVSRRSCAADIQRVSVDRAQCQRVGAGVDVAVVRNCSSGLAAGVDLACDYRRIAADPNRSVVSLRRIADRAGQLQAPSVQLHVNTGKQTRPTQRQFAVANVQNGARAEVRNSFSQYHPAGTGLVDRNGSASVNAAGLGEPNVAFDIKVHRTAGRTGYLGALERQLADRTYVEDQRIGAAYLQNAQFGAEPRLDCRVGGDQQIRVRHDDVSRVDVADAPPV